MLFVLVHGAFQSSWCWDDVRDVLVAQGHEVRTPAWLGTVETPDAPRDRSFGTAVSTVVGTVQDHLDAGGAGDVVLVGHSGGGPIVQHAAALLGDLVDRVVFVAGVVLYDGESFAGLLDPESVRDRGEESGVLDEVPDDTPPPSSTDWGSTFMNGSEQQLIQETAARLVPVPSVFATQPADLGKFWREVPACSYVFLRDDRVAPQLWAAMADRLPGVRRLTCAGPHQAMLTHPEEFAAALLLAAQDPS